MIDLISRQMAIEALRKMLYKLEEEREEYYIKEKKVDEWFIYIRPNVQDMNDLDVETIDSLPSANPWHKGTPTEDGLYVVFNKHLCYDIVEVKPWTTLHGVVAYQKIEPYKEANNGTDN